MALHTGLSYDPLLTDWEFLIPSEVSDDMLHPSTSDISSSESTSYEGRPLISGFIGIVKIFLCMADHLTYPNPAATLSPSARRLRSQLSASRGLMGDDEQRHSHKIEALSLVMRRLEATIRELPEELQMPRGRYGYAADEPFESWPLRSRQFEMMTANIHVTSLFFQSAMLEECLNDMAAAGQQPMPESPASHRSSTTMVSGTSPGSQGLVDGSVRDRLRKIRKSLAQELLDVLTCFSLDILEANGKSMVRRQPLIPSCSCC